MQQIVTSSDGQLVRQLMTVVKEEQNEKNRIIDIGMGVGTLIGLLIGIWQAATSGAWWQVLLWIIIGWLAGRVLGALAM